MSANSTAELALARDARPPGTNVTPASQALVAVIPTEALTPYTALIGVVLAAGIGRGYAPFRWSAFAVFVALAFAAPVIKFRRAESPPEPPGEPYPHGAPRRRKVPLIESLVAAFAAASWGLVMPGAPLTMVLSGNVLVFTTAAIVLGSATALAFISQVLGRANGLNELAEAPVSPAPLLAAGPGSGGGDGQPLPPMTVPSG